jgi:putative redox protein
MAEVTVVSKEKFKQHITAGSHSFYADEPAHLGGEDAGPDPYSLLLAALGACTAMTVRMYAKRKEWPLERVEVRLVNQRVHAVDCQECTSKDGYITRIKRHIKFFGPLDQEQRARLLEIAQRCPVHKTLAAEISINDYLEESHAEQDNRNSDQQ